MPRPSDCIFCGDETGSKEHTFPAALGGRRVNKGILCGTCNNSFSTLDAELEVQLQIINGLIGVRGDHATAPKLARVGLVETPLLIDHAGKPSLPGPREVSQEVLPGARRRVSMEFGSESQYATWRNEQRAAGKDVVIEPGRRVKHEYIFAPVEAAWSFGGNDAFREIGRIALNFLAHHLPHVARDVGLRAFKDFVQGKRILSEGDPRHVWYATEDAWPLPRSAFAFGHQVLLRCDGVTGEIYARVVLFDTFDMNVWFGRAIAAPTVAILVDIDPLAEHPPLDMQCRQVDSDSTPATIGITTDSSAWAVVDLLEARTAVLRSRIETRHWEVATAGLLDAINSTRMLPRVDRSGQVERLLAPHIAFFVHLANRVLESINIDEGDEHKQIVAEALRYLMALDPTSHDGLSRLARVSLGLVRVRFAEIIAQEVDGAPMTDARLRLLLQGPPGVEEVGQSLLDQVIAALERGI